MLALEVGSAWGCVLVILSMVVECASLATVRCWSVERSVYGDSSCER